MAILANSAVRTGIQILLAIVIVVLGYFLYRTIREPAEAYEREVALTTEARQRMDYVRDALVAYEREYNRYPSTLDSLVGIIRTDSLFEADRQEIFEFDEEEAAAFEADSIIYSPRSGRPFEYTVAVDDSTGAKVYLLADPDSEDFIGTDDPERATGLLNAASWE